MFKLLHENIFKKGDRVGICTTLAKAKDSQRGLVSKPGILKSVTAFIIDINLPKNTVSMASFSQITISFLNKTLIGKIVFFKCAKKSLDSLSFEYIDTITIYDQSLHEDIKAFFILNREVNIPPSTFNYAIIKTDLKMNDPTKPRVMMYGSILKCFFKDQPNPNFYKIKEKTGTVERINDSQTITVKNMFKNIHSIVSFINLNIESSSGQVFTIQSHFGKSGKVKASLKDTDQNIPNNIVGSEIKLKFCKIVGAKTLKIFQ